MERGIYSGVFGGTMTSTKQAIYDAQCASGARQKQAKLVKAAHAELERRAKRAAEPTTCEYARILMARAKRARRNKARRHGEFHRIVGLLNAARASAEYW